MKKKILILGTVLISTFASSQITINIEGQSADISGANHTIVTTDDSEKIIDLLIHNNTGATQEWNITRKRLDVPATGWTDYLCWGAEGDPFGGQCYGVSQMNTNPWNTPASLFVNDGLAGLLAIHIDPLFADGVFGHYRYYVGRTSDNPQDSVDIIINPSNSVKIVKSEISFNVFPNPADNQIQLALPSNNQEGTVKIVDVLGKVVYEEKISNSKKVYTEEFKNGVYILSFTSNGTTYTKRFVVKH